VSLRNRSRFAFGDEVIELFPRMVESLREAAEESQISLELIVADFGSEDYPLAEWVADAAGDVPYRLLEMSEPYSRGRGLNQAAKLAVARILAFLQPDMLVPSAVLERGYAVAKAGKAFFPRYQRFHDAKEIGWTWGNGTGNSVLSARLFERSGRWPEYEWMKCPMGPGTDDTAFCHRVAKVGPIVYQRIRGFMHLWHPTGLAWEEKNDGG
jgi:glycosyltransferase involved in cell wall biosynthesis